MSVSTAQLCAHGCLCSSNLAGELALAREFIGWRIHNRYFWARGPHSLARMIDLVNTAGPFLKLQKFAVLLLGGCTPAC